MTDGYLIFKNLKSQHRNGLSCHNETRQYDARALNRIDT